MNSIHERHKGEIEELEKKKEKFTEELSTFSDIEQAKHDIKQQQIDLEMKVANLGSTLKSTIAAVEEAKKKKAEIQVNINVELITDEY